MPLDSTTTEVERVEGIETVRDDQGNQQSPANTAEQQATQAAVESVRTTVDTAKTEIISTTEEQINNPNGNAGDEDGTAYPYSINPTATIHEFSVPIAAAEIAVEITTTGGDTFTVPVPSGGEAVFDRWQIDSVTISDPGGAAGRVVWWWAGR